MTSWSESWRLQIGSVSQKYLVKIPKDDSAKILAVIKSLPENPYYGDIKKMQGEENAWRRRVGSYRIFYSIKTIEKIILVFDIDRRTSNTY